jgi:hypothetical protein
VTVTNSDSFPGVDMKDRLVIDPSDTRMTFLYDDSTNVYDGKTIHYEVKALTDANLPLTVEITVIDITTTCNIKTLGFNNADVLSYPTEVYKPET